MTRGRYVHYMMRTVDAIYIASIFAMAFTLKMSESVFNSSPYMTILPFVTLGSIGFLLFEDLRVSSVYWAVTRGGPQDEETKKLLKEGGLQVTQPTHRRVHDARHRVTLTAAWA